jgi:hypothetical protein
MATFDEEDLRKTTSNLCTTRVLATNYLRNFRIAAHAYNYWAYCPFPHESLRSPVLRKAPALGHLSVFIDAKTKD